MSIKPILFNQEMVKAILDGRKTVTRRILAQKEMLDKKWGLDREPYLHNGKWYCDEQTMVDDSRTIELKARYQIENTIYVRETQSIGRINDNGDKYVSVHYKVDDSTIDFKVSDAEWKRLMKYDYTDEKFISPYWTTKETCRLFLKVADARVERLQDITEEQIIKEGLSPYDDICHDINWKPTYNDPDSGGSPQLKQGFEILWNSTVKEDWQKFASNPWVFVYEFERCEKPKGWCKTC